MERVYNCAPIVRRKIFNGRSNPPPHVRDYYSDFPEETKVTILEGALQTAKGELNDARRRIKDLYVDVGSEKEAVRKLKATLDFTTKYLKDGSGVYKGGRRGKRRRGTGEVVGVRRRRRRGWWYGEGRSMTFKYYDDPPSSIVDRVYILRLSRDNRRAK